MGVKLIAESEVSFSGLAVSSVSPSRPSRVYACLYAGLKFLANLPHGCVAKALGCESSSRLTVTTMDNTASFFARAE